MTNWLKSDTAIFLLKALGIYLVWYAVYELWLLPDGRLDEWVVLNIVDISSTLIQTMGYDVQWSGRTIGLAGTPGIILVDGCSGIAAIGLFVGFVIAYPGQWVPRICFIITGIGVIYMVNILRIIVLVLTQKYWPSIFDFTHDYSITAIFYMVVFGLWMIWVNYSPPPVSSNTSQNQAVTA